MVNITPSYTYILIFLFLTVFVINKMIQFLARMAMKLLANLKNQINQP
jgi:hypothetical protein